MPPHPPSPDLHSRSSPPPPYTRLTPNHPSTLHMHASPTPRVRHYNRPKRRSSTAHLLASRADQRARMGKWELGDGWRGSRIRVRALAWAWACW
ncbi:uncharacterized protein K441DRAFT_667173 [Cenococcum geophilum 1.58]|uniref:uncharacterized protein n=1 Tax=Cenococcum geophilum 1.58 TaxID=794803 RepID=UPI00358EA103|nr:hypothetical protein K441DRAFT_667173 [Cenococcum geophilum 1.58]